MTIKETIGITGGIGSGKSVISRLIRCNGYPVYDCDYEAKKLMNNDLILRNQLINALGENVYLDSGEINKKFLSKQVFHNESSRNKVNKIVHSAVREDLRIKRKKIKGLFFVESAILVTSSIFEMCNEIWVVEAPLKERIRRLENRDCVSVSEIKKRIESQESEFKLLERVPTTVKIENNGTTSILPFILSKINKFNVTQTYKILC